ILLRRTYPALPAIGGLYSSTAVGKARGNPVSPRLLTSQCTPKAVGIPYSRLPYLSIVILRLFTAPRPQPHVRRNITTPRNGPSSCSPGFSTPWSYTGSVVPG
ncbi:hypothetical protein HOY82DRAFT_672967, partial [Tuber indicum]